MRRSSFCIVILSLMTLPPFVPPNHAADTQPQILFYLDANRLVTLEFQITADNRSFRETWESNLDQLFKKIDKNNDGIIAGEERNDLPNTRILRIFNQSYTFRAPPASMDLKSFKDYIENKLEFPAFQITIQNRPNQNNRQRLVLSGMQNSPDKVAEVLFSHLDRDSDGKLSHEEMEHAQTTLHKTDLDQDEAISSTELVGFNYGQFFQNPQSSSPAESYAAFLSLAKGTSPREVASQITQRYDKNQKDNALTEEELGITPKLFSKHDMDGNGKWDFEEIQQFVKAPTADVIIKTRLGTQGESQQPRIAFEHGKDFNSSFQNSLGSVNLGNVQMEVSLSSNSLDGNASLGSRGGNVEEQIQRQFQSLDQDNNGYIDKEESRQLGNTTLIFQDLDPDRDEKIFLEEWNQLILPLADLMARQIHLTVTDRGRDFFRILDSDGDNRVSTRELWAMPDRAALWDRDSDGSISLSDVPSQYRLVISPGDFTVIGTGSRAVRIVSGMGQPRANPRTRGPRWFQRMDRNNDGDVSRREFLGGADDFKRLDENGDGLISPMEASLSR